MVWLGPIVLESGLKKLVEDKRYKNVMRGSKPGLSRKENKEKNLK